MQGGQNIIHLSCGGSNFRVLEIFDQLSIEDYRRPTPNLILQAEITVSMGSQRNPKLSNTV